jgi:lipopolysaccharide/colanic/teichoic acid biosynthesis glycosyltransferase
MHRSAFRGGLAAGWPRAPDQVDSEAGRAAFFGVGAVAGGERNRRYARYGKPALDFVIGSLLALLALPVIVVVAAASTIVFGAQPIFVQRRVGRNGRIIRFPKIRSLPKWVRPAIDKDDLANDEVTIPAFGRFVRRTHLDELPQLLLVPVGLMSLVGPRPALPELLHRYPEGFAELRETVRPGCTGLWQVSVANDCLLYEDPGFDVAYIAHMSLRFDLWVLWRTLALYILKGDRRVTLDELTRWQAERAPHMGPLPRSPGTNEVVSSPSWSATPRCPPARSMCSYDDSRTRQEIGMVRKRLFDLIVTIGTAWIWLPLLVASLLAVLLSSGWPCLYVSRRRVDRRRTINLLKIRVMVRNAERVANRDTIPVNDVRFLNLPIDSPLYTRVGRAIERLHLTESPQFLHVLSGRMSLVGNRPLPERVIETLKEAHPNVEDRFATPAGITGLVQLIGREHVSDATRLAIEERYCRLAASRYSARLDTHILLRTLLMALRVRSKYSTQEAQTLLVRFESLS